MVIFTPECIWKLSQVTFPPSNRIEVQRHFALHVWGILLTHHAWNFMLNTLALNSISHGECLNLEKQTEQLLLKYHIYLKPRWGSFPLSTWGVGGSPLCWIWVPKWGGWEGREQVAALVPTSALTWTHSCNNNHCQPLCVPAAAYCQSLTHPHSGLGHRAHGSSIGVGGHSSDIMGPELLPLQHGQAGARAIICSVPVCYWLPLCSSGGIQI